MTIISSKNVFIIIPVHNRCTLTMSCLEQLDKIDAISQYSVVVVDDASTDGTPQKIIATHGDRVKILYGDGNLWWAGAIDLGMRYAYENNARCIIWLNDDCTVPAGTFENLIDFVNETPNAIIGAQGVSRNDQTQVTFGGKNRKIPHYQTFHCPTGEVQSCEMLSGNLVCIPRNVVNEIGYPNRELPHYGGDTFYLMKARKAGFSLFVDARTAPMDTPGNANMYPDSWLLQGGKPLKPLSLVFHPQSMLSWKVWWMLLTCDYRFLGAIIFFIKYSIMLPKILFISALRFLPLVWRQNLKNIKQKVCSSTLA